MIPRINQSQTSTRMPPPNTQEKKSVQIHAHTIREKNKLGWSGALSTKSTCFRRGPGMELQHPQLSITPVPKYKRHACEQNTHTHKVKFKKI